MHVSIIIVNYNTSTLLRNCIESIYKHTKDITFEIIVSDNGSTDDSVQMLRRDFPEVIIIENKANLGFGAANNRGLDIAKGEFIFYLNSDTVLLNNAVKIFYDFWNTHQEINIGSMGTMLLDQNMQFIHSGSFFPNKKSVTRELIFMGALNIFLSLCYLLHIDAGKFRRFKKSENPYYGKIDYVTGADLFLKNNNLARFDENFFLYYEDTDLQFNMKANGYDSYLIQGPSIQHLCGGSVGESFNIKRKASFSRIQFELARVKYFKKNINSNFFTFFLKLTISVIWLNPFLFSKTRKFFKNLWHI